jgi:hypothetical protein
MLIDFAMEEREEESRELLMDLVNNVSQDKLFKKYLERKTVELTSESVPTRSDQKRSDSVWEGAQSTEGIKTPGQGSSSML